MASEAGREHFLAPAWNPPKGVQALISMRRSPPGVGQSCGPFAAKDGAPGLNLGLGSGEDPALVEGIAKRCTEAESGARNIERILAQGLLPELSSLLLDRMAQGETIRSIGVSIGGEGKFEYQIA